MGNEKNLKKIVVLGTGGTIAGTATHAADNLGYSAAQLSVGELLAAVPSMAEVLRGDVLVSEQVAQVDSKDMGFAIWTALAQRVQHHLTRAEVCGVVITHGTDTLEETAFFLHAVLPAALQLHKPVVLTCAMRVWSKCRAVTTSVPSSTPLAVISPAVEQPARCAPGNASANAAALWRKASTDPNASTKLGSIAARAEKSGVAPCRKAV